MLKVALTGNVASGKSTVARVWESLGARLVDADELARQAVEPGTPALEAIAAQWGDAILDDDGSLDRGALRDRVFKDQDERARLEAIVHPEIARMRDDAFRKAAAAGAPIVVADIPLLFEVGMQDAFDVVVVVDASPELRLERMVRDRGMGMDEARRIVAAQMPAELKRSRADLVIENSETIHDLEARAAVAWGTILRRADASGP
jgi:dephospho-CoA kinase